MRRLYSWHGQRGNGGMRDRFGIKRRREITGFCQLERVVFGAYRVDNIVIFYCRRVMRKPNIIKCGQVTIDLCETEFGVFRTGKIS